MVSTVVITLVASGGALVFSKHRSLTRSMERSARTFAALVSLPLANSVDNYRDTGHEILRQVVARYTELNPNLIRLQVVDVTGREAMDARLTAGKWVLNAYPRTARSPSVSSGELEPRIASLRLSGRRVAGPGMGRMYRVVAPAVETWGRHTYTLICYFSYARVNRDIIRAAAVTTFFLLSGVFLAYVVSVVLARSITQNVERLHSGVRRISASRFDERVSVDSGDEIQDLAESFNSMADRLQTSIGALREAYGRLESLDQAKRSLLATVSHELKTPLTALRGYLELLEEGRLGGLSSEAGRAVDICLKNVGRLTKRIEELVELARLERGTGLVITEQIDLGNFVKGIVETMWPRLEEKELRCTWTAAPDIPRVIGNSEHLERAFLNLLDNAIKFTPEAGTIRIVVEQEERNEVPGVRIRVVDNGIGIPGDQLENVFDRFYQIDQTSRRRYGGLGLGLALVKRAVELHHGEVSVESAPEEGSTFIVWLPVDGGERNRPGASSDRLGESSETAPSEA